jgi:polyribonucleotide 5'-hydroxyl-kinase
MATAKKVWSLNKENELRIEIPEDCYVTIKLLSGSAEVFGTEIAQNKEYTFRFVNVAVYTWYGCQIETSEGPGCSIYAQDTTPMTAYVNTHIQLEARRDVALANESNGPRVIVVGPTDHGKSTLCSILTAYAARLDRTPILVDLDVGQSMYGISGSITAIPVEKTNLHPEEGLSNINPLMYFYGSNTPEKNVDHYKRLVTILGNQIQQRLDRDIDARSSGIIVNTTGWVEGGGFDVLLHCIQSLRIDIVLVMGQDKLYSALKTSFDSSSGVAVVKLPVSGGVVTRVCYHFFLIIYYILLLLLL